MLEGVARVLEEQGPGDRGLGPGELLGGHRGVPVPDDEGAAVGDGLGPGRGRESNQSEEERG